MSAFETKVQRTVEQMGLSRDELPVVSETEDEIVWLSTNPCSLLGACRPT